MQSGVSATLKTYLSETLKIFNCDTLLDGQPVIIPATLTTYLSECLKIFTCATPIDDQTAIIFHRAQDPCRNPQNYSFDQQKRPIFINEPESSQQSRNSSLYSTSVKRYFSNNYPITRLSSCNFI